MILHGCAVGGGSITYANTSLQPGDAIWDQRNRGPGWQTGSARCRRHYATARRMLGRHREPDPGTGRPDPQEGRRCASAWATRSIAHRWPSFRRPKGETPGTTHPDPYFGGEGPERATCIACGGCMMGCRYNAKNTLDKNYLYLAEKHGARVFAEDPGGGCRSAEWTRGRQPKATKCITVRSTAWLAQGAPPLHVPRRGVRGVRPGHAWTCCSG